MPLAIYYLHFSLHHEVSGLYQLAPANILGHLPVVEAAGPSCPETLHGCCLLVTEHDRKKNILYLSLRLLFLMGPGSPTFIFCPAIGSRPSLLTNQESIREVDLSIRTSPYREAG